jgi:hypothetical protein
MSSCLINLRCTKGFVSKTPVRKLASVTPYCVSFQYRATTQSFEASKGYVVRGLCSSTNASPEPRQSEKHGFKAETSKLLDIVTNSIYTDKEIFLRELVSNAADALEKFRHISARGDKVNFPDRELAINISADKEAGTLTLEDSGVGMSRAEMMENLGTIAKSGSKAFVQAHENSSQEVARNVIGQFGVYQGVFFPWYPFFQIVCPRVFKPKYSAFSITCGYQV